MKDLKDRGAKIIIGEFYTSSARHIMCEAYKAKMTQKQGYVWFLPGWFDDKWYDIDRLRKASRKKQSDPPVISNDKYGLYEGTINMFDETEVGDLPSCSTNEMVFALNGHFSLVHAHFASDESVIEGNKTVLEWKKEVKKRLIKTKEEYRKAKMLNIDSGNSSPEIDFNKPIQLNKYSGYVYDAVWLYAYALDTLVSDRSNKSYIQNLHSERTVKEFVNIISNTSFLGVSGRINFNGRPSRLSNVRIMQWLKNASNEIFENDIGVYLPDYGDTETKIYREGKLKNWNQILIRWQTMDGTKPLDNPKECGILSTFATKLNIECQLAIIVIFIIGVAILLLIICIVFLVFRRR
jgi:hypothetical protein